MTDQGPDRRKRKRPYRQRVICTECKRKVDSDYTTPKDNAMAGRTFSFIKYVLDKIEKVDGIKSANFQLRYFSNGSSFIRWENGERLRLHPNFNPDPFGHFAIFFGQESHRPPKSEGARTPMPITSHYIQKIPTATYNVNVLPTI